MAWYRERAWQQTISIVLVLAGAGLIYGGATGPDQLGGGAWLGIVLFGLGIAAPLISQALHAYREDTATDEDG
jgi:hypothetical protein